MGPTCPKCPTISPATSVPPEVPSEKLIPGIFIEPIMHPIVIAKTNGKNPSGSSEWSFALIGLISTLFAATKFSLSFLYRP